MISWLLKNLDSDEEHWGLMDHLFLLPLIEKFLGLLEDW